MKSLFALALLATASTMALPQTAGAVGCLSGAAVGGVAGHYAGHHGLLGAAAGCAVGHHAAAVRRRNAEAAAQQNSGYGQSGAYPQNDGGQRNGGYRVQPQ